MLERTEIYRHIHVLANRGQRPSSDDWLTLIETLDRLHPRLHDFPSGGEFPAGEDRHDAGDEMCGNDRGDRCGRSHRAGQ